MTTFSAEFSRIVSQIRNNKYSKQLENIKGISQNRPVILYGAGKAVGIILVVCKQSGINITALCDSNKKGMYENAGIILPIISPQDLVENYIDASLIVTSWKFESEIRENLKSIGFNNSNIFSFWYPQRITLEIFKNNYYEGYKWAYEFYEDEKSKQLILDKINSYMASVPLSPNTQSDMYYEEVLNIGEN